MITLSDFYCTIRLQYLLLYYNLTHSFSTLKTSRCVILCPQVWQAKSEETTEVSCWTTFPPHFRTFVSDSLWSDPTIRDWQTRVELWLPFSVGSEQRGQEQVKNHLSRSLIRRRSLPWKGNVIYKITFWRQSYKANLVFKMIRLFLKSLTMLYLNN